MNDYLLRFAQQPLARRLVDQLGLPIPMPPQLERDGGEFASRPLEGRVVRIAGGSQGPVRGALEAAVERAGALRQTPEPAHGLVFDATAFDSPASLGGLHVFFSAELRELRPNGRVVIVGRPVDDTEPGARSAAQAALEGFTRSLAKELGRKGSTANLLRVAQGAEARLEGPLRFLLSPSSAFITAQPLDVDGAAAGDGAGEPLRPLAGKRALVTGAARGIGEAIARRLQREGAQVVLVDRPQERPALEALAGTLSGIAEAHDLSDANAAARLAERIGREGGLDLLIHNAGITRDRTLARMSADQWDAVLGVNLSAALRLSTALDPYLRAGGRVVCLSSIAGIAGNVGQTAYAASKSGLLGWVRSEGRRLAGRGITVNAIAPGFIETRMTAAVPFAIREAGRRLAALSQGGQPEDVASAIAFLCTPGAVGITGHHLRVCGGALLGA